LLTLQLSMKKRLLRLGIEHPMKTELPVPVAQMRAPEDSFIHMVAGELAACRTGLARYAMRVCASCSRSTS